MTFADFDRYVRHVINRIARQDVIDDTNAPIADSWGPHMAISDTYLKGFSAHDGARYISCMSQEDDFHMSEDEALKEMARLEAKYASTPRVELAARSADLKAWQRP